MSHRIASLSTAIFGIWCHVAAAEELVTVDIQSSPPSVAAGVSKLSPALLATKDADGVLKGVDDFGRVVISVPGGRRPALGASKAVKSVEGKAPEKWEPVKRLKLSYRGSAPSVAELEAIGLKFIEDYKTGSFVIVEPIGSEISATIVRAVEAEPNVTYATPLLRVRAIRPTDESALAGAPTVASRPAIPAIGGGGKRPNDARLSEMWNMENIRAPIAWGTRHDSSVIVAVLDTGVDYTHKDLEPNVWKDAAGRHGYDFIDGDADPMDLNGHGTHCAGTVGAVGDNGEGVVGVNWKVKIMPVRWLDAEGRGEVINAIKAIDFAVENGASVLSNSWFWTEDDPDLRAAIARAQAKNVLFVAAAGNWAEMPDNNGGDNDKLGTYGRYPSAYDFECLVAVAAIDAAEQLASFSEWGSHSVDLAAPGVQVLSTVLNGEYAGKGGTSMATPHVAGAAALAIAKAGGASTCRETKKQILDNARAIPALASKCVTGGTLDISFIGQ